MSDRTVAPIKPRFASKVKERPDTAPLRRPPRFKDGVVGQFDLGFCNIEDRDLLIILQAPYR